jgi:hypothetical protein
MRKQHLIEHIVNRELRHICDTCVHAETCIYKKQSQKAIIQCEMYETDAKEALNGGVLQGLCKNCDHAPRCTLPGKQFGVWHCNEYK